MPGIKIQIPKGNDAIPFPRTSGGRFCGLGQLVCFGWTYSVQISNVTKSSSEESVTSNNLASRLARTPRALSALSDTSHLMSAQIQMIGSTPPGIIPSSFVSSSSDASNSQYPSYSWTDIVNYLLLSYWKQMMMVLCPEACFQSFEFELTLNVMYH